MKKWIILLLLAGALLLAACGETGTGQGAAQAGKEPSPAAEPTPEHTPEPTPGPLVFPDGSVHGRGESELDLRWLEHENVEATAALLREMPELQRVELGYDRARAAQEAEKAARKAAAAGEAEGEEAEAAEAEDEDEDEEWWAFTYFEPYRDKHAPPPETETEPERLSWADIRALQEAAPQAEFLYRFRFLGKDLSLADERVDLNHRTMHDEGAAVREFLPCMKHCTYLDMDFCNVSDEAMAAIRDENPQMEVVWRVWFGLSGCLSVRTDVERILASEPGMCLMDENTGSLKYCTKVKYLDMGHQGQLHDWSFLGYMTDLEVAVISIGGWTDLSFVGNCTKLEYLEMCSRTVKGELDISFLAKLKDLKHLDLCCLGDGLTGYEVLEEMTGLERLWIGYFTHLPRDFVYGLYEKLPNTVINLESQTGCEGFWRYTDGAFIPCERYALLCQQFDYIHYNSVCSRYYNDPYYYPHN